MSSNETYTGYHVIANTYDTFFTAHREWYQQTRESILDTILPNAKTVCDIGCGTGYTAISIAKQGSKVFAVDVSSTMCELARANAEKANVQISVIQADLQSFLLPEPADMVLAENAVLNHLEAKLSLASVADNIWRALVPGGHFYFDANTSKIFQTAWPQWKGFAEKDDTVFVPHGGYDEAREKGWLEADYFIRDGQGWRRVSERFEHVWWTQDEIQNIFEQAGFRTVRVVDAAERKLNGKGVLPPGFIMFYLFQKVGSSEPAPTA
jgi:ubiquinone/menaquinone biosynthesis C-methylase UbiE